MNSKSTKPKYSLATPLFCKIFSEEANKHLSIHAVNALVLISHLKNKEIYKVTTGEMLRAEEMFHNKNTQRFVQVPGLFRWLEAINTPKEWIILQRDTMPIALQTKTITRAVVRKISSGTELSIEWRTPKGVRYGEYHMENKDIKKACQQLIEKHDLPKHIFLHLNKQVFKE